MAKVKAGEAFVRLSLDDELSAGLQKAGKQMTAFGKSVAIGGPALAGIGAAIITPILAASKNFADFGDNLDKVSARTGIAVESLSELGFASEQSGASIADLEKGIRGLQKGMFDAKRGAGEMLFALEELGLEYEDLKDLSPEDQFELIGDRLADIKDDSIRAAVSMKAFGKAGSALLPLFGNIKSLREEARALGITMTAETAKDAAELTDALNRLDKVFLAIKISIGAAVGPLISDLTTRFAFALGAVIKFIKANQDIIVTALKVGVIIGALGGAMLAIGGTIAVMGFAFTGLASAMGAITAIVGAVASALTAIISPVGLVIIAVVALTAAVVEYTEVGQRALEFYKGKFSEFANFIASTVKFIGKAFEAGGIDLAVKALWAVIKVEFLKGAVFINDSFGGIVENVFNAWNQITKIALNSLETVIQLSAKAANFISTGFWTANKAVVDSFVFVAEKVAKSMFLLKAISGNTYGDMIESLRQLTNASDGFINSQKVNANDLFGGIISGSEDRTKEDEQSFRDNAKEIAGEFAAAGAALNDELSRAKKEYEDIAKIVNKLPEKAKEAGDEVGKKFKGLGNLSADAIKTTSSGTFSAAAARGLDIAGIDRVALATEQTAKNTAKIANKKGLAFS